MYLITYTDNWADEMDVEGFKVYTQKEYDEYQAMFDKEYPPNTDEFHELYYGSNQSSSRTRTEIMSSISIRELEEDEFKVLKKTFPNGFGSELPGNWQ